MRLLNAPDNAEHLLESSGYVVSSAKDDDRPRGHVIHAKRCSDGASVVVKCTRKEGSEARMMTYFYHLRKLGKSLPVVGILDIIEDTTSNTVLLVLEDWGCNLAQLGKLSPVDFFHILRQCFEAVAALHAIGIAHLDISCYNILCNSQKQIAVIDFEASRCFNQSAAMHSRYQHHSHTIYPCRTTEIPPEFRTEDAYQRRHCAYKLDIFSLGVLILRFAKSSGFDCPRLVLLAEPLVACDPMRRPTAAEALIWFQKWCERVGVVLSKDPAGLCSHTAHDLSRNPTAIQTSVV
ncbi:hypothetical protein RSOLAG1IB_00107 [Rhizoctonia solani AG-1 IB]|uniref:Protein kinase domain-containing protein n=1 Tax=Thanatephorus cucumeris (strain AG1-IB / isolate 7/3/14) TaxID=1108050 RepID=A0A0B7F5W1_THACB|nr:hypothetical protein RSOLAG1IB_00107 [Rhizoctonia solani AG-1 IB]